MKYVLIFLSLLAFGCILGGIFLETSENIKLQAQLYGSGTVLLFFVVVPLFLFSRRNKTRLGEYFNQNTEDSK